MEYKTKKINLKEFNGEWNKWSEERKQEYIELKREFEQLGRDIKLQAVVSEDENGKQYFEHFEMTLEGDISIHQYNGDKEIHFYHNDLNKLEYIQNYNIEEKTGQSKPNRVNVLSNNKIDQWTKYLRAGYKQAKELSEARQKAVKEFLKEIEKRENLRQSSDKTSGYINGEHATYSYEIHNNGYIKEDIRLNTFDIDELKLFEKIEA